MLIARPVILAFGSGELFMLTLLGLSMVGALAGKSLVKGLSACGMGVLLGSVGSAPATGEYRMTFDNFYLMDGIPLVVVGLGILRFLRLLICFVKISQSPMLVNLARVGLRAFVTSWKTNGSQCAVA